MKPIKLDRDPIWKIYEAQAEEAVNKVKHHRPPKSIRFRASEITDCRLKIYHRLSGAIPLPLEPWVSNVGAAGNMGHDYFRYLAHHHDMGLSGITFNENGTQDEIDNQTLTVKRGGVKFVLSCRPDGFQELSFAGQTCKAIMEAKTMTKFQFGKLETAWKKGGNEGAINHLKLTKPSYLWQGNQSAMILGLNHVYLVCIERDLNRIGLASNWFGKSGSWEPLAGERAGGAVWELEESDRENILQKAEDITVALEEGKPPAPEYSDGSPQCNVCPVWYLCHGAKKKKKGYPVEGVVSE